MYPMNHVVRVAAEVSCESAIRRLEEAAERWGMLAVDCETTGLDPRIDDMVLLSIATPDSSFVFERPYFERREIKELMCNGNVFKLAHYSPFEYGFLDRHLGVPVGPFRDTMRALLVQDSAYVSLKSAMQHYLKYNLPKGLQTVFVGKHPPYAIGQDEISYAGNDAAALWPLFCRMIISGVPMSDFLVPKEDFSYIRMHLEMNCGIPPYAAYLTIARHHETGYWTLAEINQAISDAGDHHDSALCDELDQIKERWFTAPLNLDLMHALDR